MAVVGAARSWVERRMDRAALVVAAGRGAVVIAAIAAGPARGGGFGIPEVGARRTAMASIIGRPDDPSSIYHNPAGLVLQPGWQLYASFGLAVLGTELRLAPWDQSDRFLGVAPQADGYYATVRPSRALGVIPMLAATAELIPDRLVVGGAVFVGNATGAAFESSAVTRYHLIDGYVVAPQAVIAAAYRLGPTLTIGATLGAIELRVHGKRAVFPIVMGADISKLVGTRPELVLDGSGTAPTWMVAAFGQPHPRVTWGATVTGRVDATLSGPLTVTYSDDAADPGGVVIGRQTTQQLLPWAVMAGGNVDLTPQLELGGELRYWLYRQYQSQHTDIAGIALLTELDTPKRYRDSWAASGGARLHAVASAPGLELMAGVSYDRSPAPPETVTLDQPSFTHWGAHGGLRYQLGRYRLGASYVHYWYAIPTITGSVTSPPSNLRGSGGNDIVTASLEVRL
jgi:long-subunit fatty acid transport protein